MRDNNDVGRIGLVLQYLHWALIAAHQQENKERPSLGLPLNTKVIIEIDLVRGSATTRTE